MNRRTEKQSFMIVHYVRQITAKRLYNSSASDNLNICFSYGRVVLGVFCADLGLFDCNICKEFLSSLL